MEESNSQILQATVWFFQAVSVLAFGIRMLSKWIAARRLHTDDALVLAALFTNIGASVAIFVSSKTGLGNSVNTLTEPQIQNIEKGIYVADMLFILTMALSRLSNLFLLRLLFITEWQLNITQYFVWTISAWGFSATMSSLLQCSTPSTWNIVSSDGCFDLTAFWYYFGVSLIIVDLSLIILPTVFIRKLQISAGKKVITLSCFGARISDIAVAATQLSFVSNFNGTAADFSGRLWQWYLCAQILQMVSMITCCIPYLRQILDQLPSGMLASDDLRRRGLTERDISQGFTQQSDRSYTLKDLTVARNSSGGDGRDGAVGTNSQTNTPLLRSQGSHISSR